MAEKIVYRIIDRKTGQPEGVYSRSYHDVYDFPSEDAARNANVHGIYRDEARYRIARIRITEEETNG